jgi:hypothetical protein
MNWYKPSTFRKRHRSTRLSFRALLAYHLEETCSILQRCLFAHIQSTQTVAPSPSGRSYTREMAQMELCYALTPLLRNFPVAGGLQAPGKVLATPELIPRVVELVSCPDSDGEVQRIALMCLVVIAELSRKTAEAVMRAGGKEAAEKALKAPFAGPNEVSPCEILLV